MRHFQFTPPEASARRSCPASLTHRRSGGAVLIIVLTLLSMLVFLGFFYFSFTSQSENQARSYASAEDYKIDADELLDKTWEQVLVGTRSIYPNSALYGNRHSILSHIVGPLSNDLSPTKDQLYVGAGVSLMVNENNDGNLDGAAGEYIRFDFDGDGYPDATLDAVNDPLNTDMDSTNNLPPVPLNFSKVARYDVQFYSSGQTTAANYQQSLFNNTGLTAAEQNVFLNYQPHVGYTYPDLNSLFLSYISTVSVAGGTQKVVIPSFFRPQIELPARNNGFGTYYTTQATSPRSLRPHQYHLLSNGTSPRFISAAAGTAAQSGDTRRVIGPFPFQTDLNGNNVYNELGIVSGDTAYELDVDTDGDGIRDAIWMDLDLPLIDLPDGRQVVPLVAVRIVDADGLLNINLAGNAEGLIHAGENPLLNTSGSVSKSNLGLSASELNPVWALMADSNISTNAIDMPSATGAAMKEFNAAFGTTPASSLATANAELIFLMYGRKPSDGGSMLSGRFGEPEPILAFPNARAGQTGVDDDQDSATATGNRIGGGQNARTENFTKSNNSAPSVQIPPAVHPLDFLGLGNLDSTRSYLLYQGSPSYLSTTVGAGAQQRLSTGGLTSNPSVWPTYLGFWHMNQDSIPTPYGIQGYYQALGGNLQQNTVGLTSDDLIDEGNELIVHPWLYNVFDDVFKPSEMAGLHLSNADFPLSGEHCRARDLAPFAFREAQSASVNRQRFTTDSWDRLEFAHSRLNPSPDTHGASGGGPDQAMPRQGEFTVWSPFPTHVLLNDTYNSDAASIHFPPQFGGTAVASDLDPYRVELRRLLWSTIRLSATGGASNTLSNYDRSRIRPQHRLNVNELLVNFDSAGNPLYRPLTPHPVFASGDALPSATPMPAMDHTQLVTPEGNPTSLPAVYQFSQITTNHYVQEWWARYDRQRMARDIYVLLWTLSNGNDLISPANTAGQYSAAQAREMAQFAVNVVDALDRDDVITRFEYDNDLTNGWDSPSSVVYGVESQLLTFSEVMMINQPQAGSTDFTTTWHVDNDETGTDNAHQWLYIELRNTSPFSVPLQQNSWRIVRVQQDKEVGSSDGATQVQAAVTIQNATVGAGQNFLIACHDGKVYRSGGSAATDILPADFFADFQGTNSLDSVVPLSTATVAANTDTPTVTGANIDLTWTGHSTMYNITKPLTLDVSGAPTVLGTALVGRRHDATVDSKNFDLVLQRRRNLGALGQGEQVGANELWVEVDRFQVRSNDVQNFTPGATQTDIQNGLSGTSTGQPIRSLERSQPFAQTRQALHTGASYQNHTLTEANLAGDPSNRHRANQSLTPLTQFSIWEPHFNRDFSSVMELLSIPIYGYQGNSGVDPDTLTPFSGNERFIGGAVANLATPGVSPARMGGYGAAALRFFNPSATLQSPFASPPAGVLTHYQNRWYRLFEFVTVPDGSEESTATQMDLQRRVPGKVNLNTVRDEAVYKGVLDDGDQLAILDATTGSPTTNDNSNYDSTNRNWYDQLLRSRDVVDVLAGVALPGGIFSRPFRGFSYVYPDFNAVSPNRDASIEFTLLRSWFDSGTGAKIFGLFEARSRGDATNNTVDFHTRNRLLGKVHNRTTNRSHVYIVWTTVGFFEAHRLNATNGAASGEVQIGAEATDITRRRAFMVCDMSRLEEAYEDPDPTDNDPGYYDFRKFIIYRKLIK